MIIFTLQMDLSKLQFKHIIKIGIARKSRNSMQ